MSLDPGARLGPYEILAAIGAGGMGEVYRARDPRLGRDVAIKVISDGLSSDPERLKRFEQEARAAAALNHPNILAVFDIGHDAAAPYVVSELLEGGTLRERLEGIPVRKAVEYAIQIARGLAAAHAKGIVHRDLKPENVFVTDDGLVKILDFGLAKLTEVEPAFSSRTALPTTPPQTLPGVVLGTIGYMAPEQVRGLAADHRSDIFAFGTILYEALSGRRAFAGETQMDAMTAILKEHPPDLPVSERRITPALARIVDRCLEKSPDARFQSAGDLAFALESLSSSSSDVTGPLVESGRRASTATRERLGWAAATIAAAVAGYGIFFFTQPKPELPATIRFEVGPPPGTTFATGIAAPLQALSPDGRRMVFGIVKGNGVQQLAVRSFDATESLLLPGTERVSNAGLSGLAFWAPDNRSIGFFLEGKLRKIDVSGGPSQALCDAQAGEGGTWNGDGTIVFAPSPNSGLVRVSAAGGTPVPVTTLDAAAKERSHRWPSFLPDGRHFVYVAQAGVVNTLYVGSLDSPDRIKLFQSDSKAVYADGHLLFLRDGTLFAQPFDARSIRSIGDAFPIAQDVGVNGNLARAAFSASGTGVITYRTNTGGGGSQLAWFDRTGKQLTTVGEVRVQAFLALSSDGQRAAVSMRGPGEVTPDIWIYDVERGVPTRATTDRATEDRPVFSPDGSRLVFDSDRNGSFGLYLKALNGTGAEEPLFADGANNSYPASWSPDGRFILFSNGSADSPTGNDLWALPLDGDRKPVAVVKEPFNQINGQFSSDGRWIAYMSNESGRTEIYVTPFPGPGAKVRVSADGGEAPQWRRDGTELFYSAPSDAMMVATVNGKGPRFEVIKNTALFTRRLIGVPNGGLYAVSPDGQRLLLNIDVEQTAPSPMTVVLNWTASLKK